MSKNIILFALLLTSLSLGAQFSTNEELEGSNVISSSCDCLTFVSDCSRAVVPNIDVRFSFACEEERTYSSVLPVNGQGQICRLGSWKDACTVSVCVEDSDWEVCEVVGCEVRLKKTLSTLPFINDELLGLGELSPGYTAAYKLCERIHRGGLNLDTGPEAISLCPGEEAILRIEDFSLSATSGYCLTVNVRDGGELVKEKEYGSADTDGSTVDITDLLSDLSAERLYELEMIIACCRGNDAESDCTINTRKFAYFRLLPPFSFSAVATDGAIPGDVSSPFPPSTTPDGTILSNLLSIPPLELGVYTITLTEVINTVGAEVEYQLFRSRCTSRLDDDEPVGSSGLLPGQNGQAFAIIVNQDSNCECYRLALSYDDGCGDGKTTRDYYFQIGPGCTSPLYLADPTVEILSAATTPFPEVKLRTNPVVDELVFEGPPPVGTTPATAQLQVYRATGQLLDTQVLDFSAGQQTLPFNHPPGIYVYLIQYGEETFSGKIVKK
ncbi:MAG: T9SS type A sorting domain-containing protein [Bacteroidota bacterium]